MRDEAAYLAAMGAATNREAFLDDPTLRRAFVRSIEVLGEAAKQIPKALTTPTRVFPGATSPACATG